MYGLRSDALITEGLIARTREGDTTVLDCPTRRDLWFGHGFVLDQPPSRARLDTLIAQGRARYTETGAQKFVIVWERALGSREPFGIWPGGVVIDRAVVQVFDGTAPEPDPRVTDVQGERMWRSVAALAESEYPEFGAFTERRFEDHRAAVAAGRARSVTMLDASGEPACTVTLYRGGDLARFQTPVTRTDARGRGLFTACARTLLAWALADKPRSVVILANHGSGPVALYERLGFKPVAFDEAAIVTLSS